MKIDLFNNSAIKSGNKLQSKNKNGLSDNNNDLYQYNNQPKYSIL